MHTFVKCQYIKNCQVKVWRSKKLLNDKMDSWDWRISKTQYKISNDFYLICKDLGQVNHLKVCIGFVYYSQEWCSSFVSLIFLSLHNYLRLSCIGRKIRFLANTVSQNILVILLLNHWRKIYIITLSWHSRWFSFKS